MKYFTNSFVLVFLFVICTSSIQADEKYIDFSFGYDLGNMHFTQSDYARSSQSYGTASLDEVKEKAIPHFYIEYYAWELTGLTFRYFDSNFVTNYPEHNHYHETTDIERITTIKTALITLNHHFFHSSFLRFIGCAGIGYVQYKTKSTYTSDKNGLEYSFSKAYSSEGTAFYMATFLDLGPLFWGSDIFGYMPTLRGGYQKMVTFLEDFENRKSANYSFDGTFLGLNFHF